MQGQAVYFSEPFHVTVQDEPFSLPSRNEVLARTIVSAISPGTELLIYRGEWPRKLAVDATIPALSGEFRYPLKYGYATVARIIEVGPDVPSSWVGRVVFVFAPHQSHILTTVEQLVPLPDNMAAEDAAFLPNMETAVSLVMDGRPIIGERVAVLGQGVVGLLTAGLLARFPLERLVTLDRYALRRKLSRELGIDVSLDPADPEVVRKARDALGVETPESGTDLTYELTGNPAALDLALELTGFSGRAVIGSWYGAKRSEVDLGGRFHRGRIRVLSSQVSTLAPELTGLWTKSRRLQYALRMAGELKPSRLVTHRFHVSRAAEAYALLHEHPEQTLQVIFTYEDLS
jgi:2-desacetyl-2-hydroxyethyl bacteriochlorophyllide A dehydrogenase